MFDTDRVYIIFTVAGLWVSSLLCTATHINTSILVNYPSPTGFKSEVCRRGLQYIGHATCTILERKLRAETRERGLNG
jgi:hypothetical protein